MHQLHTSARAGGSPAPGLILCVDATGVVGAGADLLELDVARHGDGTAAAFACAGPQLADVDNSNSIVFSSFTTCAQHTPGSLEKGQLQLQAWLRLSC